MKGIKTKGINNAPRILDNASRIPKELMRRSIISTKEQAEHTAANGQYDESPVEYAENRAEQTTVDAAHHIGESTTQSVKNTVKRATDTRKRIKEAKQMKDESGGTGNRSSFHVKNSTARNYAKSKTQRSTRSAKGTIKTAEHSSKAAKGTVKTAQKSVKTAKTTVKTAKHTVKTAEKGIKATAKAAEKAAQAAAKAAKAAAAAAKAAAKVAVAAAKAAVKVITAIIKAIIAAVKALIAFIAAGGWVAVVIIIVVVLVIALLAVFGVFSANESQDGSKPMTEAIETINTEFADSIDNRIAVLSGNSGADVVEIIYEGDMEDANTPVSNWADVVSVYAAKTSFDPENPADVTVVNDENIQRLRTVFYDMNEVSYRTETETETRIVLDDYGAVVLDEDGELVTETTITLYIYVNVVSTDYRDAAKEYAFTEDQNQMLEEMMLPEYYPLFAELLGDTVGDGGEYGLGLNINPDLPPNTVGAQIVEAAKKYIGRSYSSMDCSKLARTAYNDVGLTSMNGLNSHAMAQKCNEMGVLFTDPSQLQAGDLIFFARKDAARGEGYCTDRNRCGSGKCKRWNQIHHVAIYINDVFLIDSTGGKNSVQIRKHWGQNGSEWQWICFGRPTN